MKQLSSIFCLEVCAYAIMSNHFHIVLCVNEVEANKLERDEVIVRWTQLFKALPLVARYQGGDVLLKVELELVGEIVKNGAAA